MLIIFLITFYFINKYINNTSKKANTIIDKYIEEFINE